MVGLPSRMALPLSSTTRQRLAEGDKRWHVKLLLRTTATLFSLIAASLFAAAIPQWNANFFHVSGPSEGDWQDGMPIAALTLSFLFNTAALAYTLLTYRTFHPILNLTFSFLVWGLLIPAITFAAWGGLFEVWRPALRAPDGKVFCNVLNSFAKECNPILYSVGGLELGGVIMACLVWVVEVSLFIFAAIETYRWRAARMGKLTNSGKNGRDGRFVELGERNMNMGMMEPDDVSLLKERTRAGQGGKNGAGIKMPLKALAKRFK